MLGIALTNRYLLDAITGQNCMQEGGTQFQAAAKGADMLLAIGIQDPIVESILVEEGESIKTALFYDCSPDLQQLTRLDGTQADRFIYSPPSILPCR